MENTIEKTYEIRKEINAYKAEYQWTIYEIESREELPPYHTRVKSFSTEGDANKHLDILVELMYNGYPPKEIVSKAKASDAELIAQETQSKLLLLQAEKEAEKEILLFKHKLAMELKETTNG